MITQSDIIAHKIIDCATTVYNTLGNGFQEITYQRALAVEMNKLNLNFQDAVEIPVFDSETEIGTRWVDFIVENMVAIEIKAIHKMETPGKYHAVNNSVVHNFPHGILINFGNKRLEFNRVCNKKKFIRPFQVY